jgi:pimeloyl-ACP methyl ester carboxylesterase
MQWKARTGGPFRTVPNEEEIGQAAGEVNGQAARRKTMNESVPEMVLIGNGDKGREIAVRHRPGGTPGLFWLGGFRSDMEGSKATAVDAFAARRGLACTRFDYSGHGRSGGRFEDGTISRWLEEAEAVFGGFAQGPQIVVGSSMGGWIALLLAEKLAGAGALAGLVLVAPAVDMTATLMWDSWSSKARKELETAGVYFQPSGYADEPYPITRALIEDGRSHLFGDRLIATGCPVHILQGTEDTDVPWTHATGLVAHLASDDVVLTLVKGGDHRLSRPEDLARLEAAIEGLIAAD